MRAPWLLALMLVAGAARAQQAQQDAPVTGGVPRFVPPRIVTRVAAQYPEEARRLGLSATVVLELDVDEKGAVGAVAVKQSAGHGFDEAALAAVKQFTFAPATNDGAPVPSRVTYAYKFVLRSVAAPPTHTAAAAARLDGRVLVKGQRTPLAGGSVIAVPREPPPEQPRRYQAELDADGRFSLTSLPAGRYRVVVSGNRVRRFEAEETLAEREALSVAYYVEPNQYSTYESTVRGGLNREELARQTLTTEELMKMPGSFGDALRAVENLPGVARAPFNTGLLIVRGGKPTDSKVFLGAGEVPQLYHFGGLTSIIPTRLVAEVEYLPGNFGVRYGRASAGVIDVELREGRRDRWHGSLELNAFDVGATAEGPVGKGSLLLAARRSYVDAVLAAALPRGSGVNFTSAPVYYDYQAILDYPVGGGKLKTMILGSDDQLKLVFDQPSDGDPALTNFGTHIFFHKAQLRWTRTVDAWAVLAQLGGGYSGQSGAVGRDLTYSVGIGSVEARLEGRRALGRRLRLLVGGDGSFSNVALDLSVPAPTREGQIPSPISATAKKTQHEVQNIGLIGLYSELQWKPHARVTITGGLRFDWYSPLHTVAWDPRLAARITAAKYTTLKFGVGSYTQSPQAIDFNRVFGNPAVRPERALHVAASVEQGLAPGLMAEATGFYKHLWDLSTATSDYTLQGGKITPENVASVGGGRIYGLEVLLRQSVSKYLFGWVSYTLMRSERKDCATCEYRLFDFDQTHILVLAIHGYLPRGWELGLRFRYISGLPATPPYGGYYDADADVYSPARGPVNTTRLEDFHSLDFRVDKTFLFKQWTLRLYLDIYNIYNHQNQEVVQPSYDFTRTQPIRGLPIIPSFGVRAEL